MKTLLIPLVAGMILFTSCATTNYIINGAETQELNNLAGNTSIHITNDYHIEEHHKDEGGPKGITDEEDSPWITFNRLLKKSIERVNGDDSNTVYLEDYIENASETFVYNFRAKDGDDDGVYFEFTNPIPNKVRMNFIPFSQHPQLVYDGQLRIAFGVLEFTKVKSGEAKDSAKKSFYVPIPVANLPDGAKAMEFIIEGSDYDYTHKHREGIDFDKDMHRNWHTTSDPRKGG